MKTLFFLFFFCLTSVVYAQTDIKIEEAKDHIGDSVHIVSKIYGVKYFADAKEPVTLINIGAAYPNQLLTAVVRKDVRGKMLTEPTQENLVGKEVHLRGKVELFKGKPQIMITDPSQFQLVGDKGEVLPFKN